MCKQLLLIKYTVLKQLIYICSCSINTIIFCCLVDDPLDASPLHFGAGAWGVLARPIFANDGLIFGNVDNFPAVGSNISKFKQTPR